MNELVVQCENLTKVYGRQRALDALNLGVVQGEIFGYLGSNGAGKTTTIRCLLDLIHPTAGRASVLGLDTHRDSIVVRRRIGYLPGDLRLYAHMTARELLHYLARLRGGIGADRIDSLAERFSANLSQRCGAMSHGQRQKIGLIQAVMHRPELLILDEPTATLDPLMQHTVHAMLREMQKEGVTIFLSSHDLTEVSALCDRAGILRQGTLIAVEDVHNITRQGRHTLSIEFGTPVPAAVFEHLVGVDSVTSSDHTVTLNITGDLDPVIKEAAKHPVRNIHSIEADLDETFRHYYEDERDASS